jgi:NADH dehydrogenase
MHKRALISIPFGLAGIMGKFAELLPKPMLTADQVTLLQYDNIPSGGFPGLVELGIDPTPIEAIVPKYLERFVNRKARTQEKYS